MDGYLAVKRGGFKVSSGTVSWYGRRYGADFGSSEIASHVRGRFKSGFHCPCLGMFDFQGFSYGQI